MVQWLMFNVVFPLLPIGLVLLVVWITSTNLTFFFIIRDGQLCIYSTTLSALALWNIFKSSNISDSITSVGGIFFCFLLSSFVYGVTAYSRIKEVNDPQEETKLGIISLLAAAVTTLVVAYNRSMHGWL